MKGIARQVNKSREAKIVRGPLLCMLEVVMAMKE